MAGIKISQLSDGGSIGILDQVAVARGAETYKVGLKQVVTTGENVGIGLNTAQIYAGENETSTTSLRFRSLSAGNGINVSNVGNNVVLELSGYNAVKTTLVADGIKYSYPVQGSSTNSIDYRVDVDGILLEPNKDYYIANSSITFTEIPPLSSKVVVVTNSLINQTNIAAQAIVSEFPPASAANGTLWFNSSSADLSLYYTDEDSSQWVNILGGGGGGANVQINETAPTNATAGDLWFNSSSGILSIYYDDGDSAQWVIAVPGGGGGASVAVQDTPPSGVSEGNLWYDSSSGIMSIYYDSQWIDVGGGDATTPSTEIANLQAQIDALNNTMQNIGNYPYLEYAWVTAPNTAGQTITANTITTLTIDTEVADTGNFGSISSNEITLAAGTYQFEANTHASAATNIGGQGTLALYNITDTVYVSRGSSQSGASDNCDNPILIGRFTITAQKTFDLRYYNSNASQAICYIKNTASNETSTITTAGAEQRTTIKLWKVG